MCVCARGNRKDVTSSWHRQFNSRQCGSRSLLLRMEMQGEREHKKPKASTRTQLRDNGARPPPTWADSLFYLHGSLIIQLSARLGPRGFLLICHKEERHGRRVFGADWEDQENREKAFAVNYANCPMPLRLIIKECELFLLVRTAVRQFQALRLLKWL